jgi:hypothetical protein
MTDIYKEINGFYTGELKKAFTWVEDEGVGKALSTGEELMVRNGFLLKRVRGVSKVLPEDTSPLAQPIGTPTERFPAGFTPEPPIPNKSTGLYDGWMIVGDNRASMEADESSIYEGFPAMYRAFHYYLTNSRDAEGRLAFKRDKQTRKYDIPDGAYRYTDGAFVPLGSEVPDVPREMYALGDYIKAKGLQGVVFEHEAGSEGVVMGSKVPERPVLAAEEKMAATVAKRKATLEAKKASMEVMQRR